MNRAICSNPLRAKPSRLWEGMKWPFVMRIDRPAWGGRRQRRVRLAQCVPVGLHLLIRQHLPLRRAGHHLVPAPAHRSSRASPFDRRTR
eukprot:scaffold306564_cov28-Tisochrysis_lutea.AAC.3